MARKPRRAPKAAAPPQIPASAWANFGRMPQPIQKTAVRGRDIRPYLNGSAPGLWASDHFSEAKAVTGWQFVAIRAKACMASQADVSVHRLNDVDGGERRLAKLERRLERARGISEPLLKAVACERLEAKADTVRKRVERLRARPPIERIYDGAVERQQRKLLKAVSSGPESTRPDRSPQQPNHPLVKLLRRWNNEWSGVTAIFALVQQIAATGVGLVWCIRNELGVPVELYVIPTGLAIPRMPSATYPNGSYYITPLSVWGLQPHDTWSYGALGNALMTGAEVDARDVKKISWPHPLYLTDGMSPLAAGSLWVDVANEMDRARFYRFQNSERPGLVFKISPEANPSPADIAQFREDLRGDSAGTPNTGKHLLCPPGIEPEQWAQIERELEFVGSNPQVRDMNLALHGMTPISCGIAEAQAYAAYWAAIKQTTELAVQPMLNLIAGELTEFLGGSWPGGRCEISLNAPAIDDSQLLEQRLATDISAANVLTVREYRAIRGLPPFGDVRDDEFAGTKVTVRASDMYADVPGPQVGPLRDADAEPGDKPKAKKEGDGKPSKDGPALHSPFRAAPGRADRNGKSLNGTH